MILFWIAAYVIIGVLTARKSMRWIMTDDDFNDYNFALGWGVITFVAWPMMWPLNYFMIAHTPRLSAACTKVARFIVGR